MEGPEMRAIKGPKSAWAKPTLRRFPMTEEVKAKVLASTDKPLSGEHGNHSDAPRNRR